MMSRYSFDDTRELAPDVEDTRADGPLDSLGRDVEDFSRDCSHGLFNDYDDALFAHVDMLLSPSTPMLPLASPHARMGSDRETQRALFEDAVTRYLRSHADGAYVGVNRRMA
jgi:hypothetical protein